LRRLLFDLFLLDGLGLLLGRLLDHGRRRRRLAFEHELRESLGDFGHLATGARRYGEQCDHEREHDQRANRDLRGLAKVAALLAARGPRELVDAIEDGGGGVGHDQSFSCARRARPRGRTPFARPRATAGHSWPRSTWPLLSSAAYTAALCRP